MVPAIEFSYLSDIEGDAEDWLIRARVCRMWDAVNTKDNSLISIYMILVDEKENLMHAAIRKHLVPRFRHQISEGLVYSLRNVKVAMNTSHYRPLASNQTLLFLPVTEVVQLDEDVVRIPRYGFQFVNLPKLQARAGDVSTLSDIVGCFCGYGEVEVVGAGFKKRDIRIFTDYTVTLWGKLGEQFDPTLYIGDGAPYVIVIFSVTVKTFQRSLTFSTTNASKIYVNPEVEHVSSIRERFSALPPAVVAIEGPISSKLTPEEAMFVNRMTVESLVRASCAGELQVDIMTLKATITAINNRFGWFCINLQVEDPTGTTTVVLLNSTVEHLLDVSAKKLINKIPEGDTSVPLELQALVGKEFVYKLKLNKYNLVEGLQDYGVSAVFTPVEELEVAYEKNAQAQASQNRGDCSSSSQAGGSNERKRKLSTVIEAVEAAKGGGNGAP
ncbi:hypothetical protein AgCh_030552 [Apium graveolens]